MNRLPWLLFCLLSASCAGKIEGVVFLDANANGVADPGEQTLTNVAVKVSRANEVVAHTKTDLKGHFSIKGRDAGYYCIEIEEPALQQSIMRQISAGDIPETSIPSVNSNIGLGPPIPKVKKQIVGSPPATPTPPVVPPPPAPQPTPPAEEEKETEKPQEPSRPFSPAAQTERRSSGVVCQNFDESGFRVDVGVMLDYKADVARMPPPLKKIHKSGDAFELGIPVPFGCVLKPLFIPDGLEIVMPQGRNKMDPAIAAVDAAIGRVDFDESVLTTSAVLDLRVREDLPLGVHSVTIQPEAVCPDGQTVVLNAIPIDLKSLPQLVVWQKIAAKGIAGEQTTWEVFVENRGDRDLRVTVLAQAPIDFVSLIPVEGMKCHIAGDKVECPALDLPRQNETADGGAKMEPLKFQVQFLNVEEERAVGFQVSVKVEDYEGEPIQATEARVVIEPRN